jgi:hypothetical protein
MHGSGTVIGIRSRGHSGVGKPIIGDRQDIYHHGDCTLACGLIGWDGDD